MSHDMGDIAEELNSLAYEALLFPGQERIPQQWKATSQKLFDVMEQGRILFKNPQQLAAFDEIYKDISQIDQVFKRLIKVQKNESDTRDLLTTIKTRLTSQVQVKNRRVILNISKLVVLIQAEIQNFLYRSGFIIAALTIFLTSFVFMVLRLTEAKISRPISELHEDFAAVSRGNLNHKAKLNTSDELGELAQSFNQMTQSLKKTMASRDELEHEIDQRKLTQASLREVNKSLKLAQKIGHIGSWDWNIVSNELAWTDEIYIIFGLKPQEFGATYDAFIAAVHPEDRELVGQAVETALNEQRTYSITHRVVRPDGSERIVHERGEVQVDDSGDPIQMVGTVQDITERHHLEVIIRKKQLEAISREKQNEKMNSIISLTSGMAHELNSPLSALLLSAQNLARRFSSERPKNIEVANEVGIDLKQVETYMEKRNIQNILESMFEAGKQSSSIIQNLMSLSQKPDEEQTKANVNDLVEAAITMAEVDYKINQTCKFKDIKIVRELTQNLPPVLCQTDEIKRAILSVLANAAQAMSDQDQAPMITLRTRQQDGQIYIEIEDNGPGMVEEILKRIFDPFFTTSSPQRKGLGLTTAYSIICDSHKGRMNAESEPDRGTKIIIELPFITQAGKSRGQPA